MLKRALQGDVSMTRQDAAIGDNVHFQDSLYDEVDLTAHGADRATHHPTLTVAPALHGTIR